MLLPPPLAAKLAFGVYQLHEVYSPFASDSLRTDALGCKPEFVVSAAPPGERDPFMRSSSGALPGGAVFLGGFASGAATLAAFEPIESNFGYVGMGDPLHKGGLWDSHMVVVTRGTMGADGISEDWISNYNIGLQPGPGGLPVHAGFNKIWMRFHDFVTAAVKHYHPTHIHCVGHSLGGALASLNAQMLAQAGHAVSLYTFGAPRVGALAYATQQTVSLGVQAKRVYHPADPVPMIPMMPFLHAPFTGGIRLNAPAGLLVSPSMHKMANSYLPLVEAKEWSDLEAGIPLLADFQIDLWLKQSAKENGGYLMHSMALLERISIGLARLLKKAAIYVIGSGLSARVTATLTALDFIAWLLARAAEMADAIKEEIVGLVNAIYGFLGRAMTNSVVSLTRTALRWVLDLLFSFLASAANKALGPPY